MSFRLTRAILWCLLGFAAVPAQAQDKRVLGIDDLLTLKIVGDPQVSPDGNLAAFTVTVASAQENRNVTRIWLVSLVDGTSRELTRGPGSDQSPRWATDNRSLWFISTRGGSPQVWRIRIDGGEPEQLTKVPTGVNAFFVGPDTTTVYVTSDVKWPADQEIDRRTKDFPTSAKIWTDLFSRHWNEWRVGVRQHLLKISVAEDRVTDLTPLDRDVPSLALGGDDIAISPLGTELAIVYNPDSTVARSTNNDIFLIGPDGSGLVPMTTGRGNDHSPTYSPNARWIAYLSMATPGFEADRQQVMIYDRATGERKSLTADWDLSAQSIAWDPDSKSVVVEVEERGNHNLYRVVVPTGVRTLLITGGVNTAPQFTPRGDGMVFLRQTAIAPPDIYVVRWDGKPMRQLTGVNGPALARLDLAPLEKFGFVGARGDSVFGWTMKPPKFDPKNKYPLLYLIHGGPQGAWLDSWSARWNYAMFAARGYVVAAVNFHGSTGYGQEFTNSISRHWGDYPFEDLMKGLDRVAALPYVDSTRMGAAGASYGGYMIYWLAGHTDRFKTLVAHDGVFNIPSMTGSTEELWFPAWEFGGLIDSPEARALMEQWSPHNHVAQWKTPMLVVHGQQDFRIDISEGYQAFTAAKVRGIDTKFLYFGDEGHWVLKPRNRRLWWGTVLDWADQYLKPNGA
ncbi:MAG: S9 family peptidase [Gemmatimonadota bacterium]